MYAFPSLGNIFNYYNNQAQNFVANTVNWENAQALKNAALARPDIAVQFALPVIGLGITVSYLALSCLFTSKQEQPAVSAEVDQVDVQPAVSKEIVPVETPKPEPEVEHIVASELAKKREAKVERPGKWGLIFLANRPHIFVSGKLTAEQINDIKQVVRHIWNCPRCNPVRFQHQVSLFPSFNGFYSLSG